MNHWREQSGPDQQRHALRTEIETELAWLQSHPKDPERTSRIVEANIRIDAHNRLVADLAERLPRIGRDYGQNPATPAPEPPAEDQRRYGPLRDLVSEALNEARRRGDFDNLPGRGQPLKLRESDPFAGVEGEINGLLREAGFTPEWVELRQQIAAEINWLRSNPPDGDRSRRITGVNELIAKHNRLIPNPSLAFPRVPPNF